MTQRLDIDKMLADAEYAYAMDEECGWDAPDDIIRALRMLKRRTEACRVNACRSHAEACDIHTGELPCDCGTGIAEAALAYQGEGGPDA